MPDSQSNNPYQHSNHQPTVALAGTVPISYRWVLAGAVFAGLSVIAGAFGAHAIEGMLAEAESGARRLAAWNTAARYQMYHALALMAVGIFPTPFRSLRMITGWLFVSGMLIFSGLLYVYSLSYVKVLGAIVPIGGLSMILGWGTFSWMIWKTGRASSSVSDPGAPT